MDDIRVDGLWKVYGTTSHADLSPEGDTSEVTVPGSEEKPYGQRTFEGITNRIWPTVSKLRRPKARDNVIALRDISLDFPQGTISVVMGLSGSGKSTLLRCINGLATPTLGQVFLGDEEISSATPTRQRQVRGERIAMVFQHYALLPHRSVLSNVAFGLELRRVDPDVRDASAREALDQVHLLDWADRYPRELSGGMKQRVGLARALTTGAGVLLLDEPFSGLDPITRRDLQAQLLGIQSNLHKTMVFVTHDLEEAMRLGDRVAILQNGRLVQQGTPHEIVFNPASDYIRDFVQDVNKLRVLNVGALLGVTTSCDLHPIATLNGRKGPSGPQDSVVVSSPPQQLLETINTFGQATVVFECGCLARAAVSSQDLVATMVARGILGFTPENREKADETAVQEEAR